MSGRFWITGVQLGMLGSKAKQTEKNKDEIIDEIIENQFIGDYPTDKDKEKFIKWLKSAPVIKK